MKFGKIGTVGKVTLVCGLALSVATLFSACGTLTVGFLYVATTSQTPGQIEVYEINSEAGSLRTIPTSPFPSGGRNPIAETVSSDFKNLYVANNDDNNITQFGIGNDGKLYSQSTINTPGTFPMALAVANVPGSGSTNSYIYVVDQLQPIAACTQTNPCPGAIAGYAITPSNAWSGPGSLGQQPAASCNTATKPSSDAPTCINGTPVTNTVNGAESSYVPLQLSANDTTVLTPTAVAVSPNGSFAYVTAYNSSTSQGYLFTFAINADGSLTTVPSGETYSYKSATIAQVPASLGKEPSAIVVDAASSYVYIADKLLNLVGSYSIQSSGLLTQVSTASTGSQPSAATLSSAGFLYVTNSIDGTINGYTSNSGALTNTGTYATGADPVAVLGDPRQLGFLYTVNFLDNSLSGFQVNPTTGVLVNTQHTPYASSTQPAAIAGIPHSGNTH
jgi:6-phosphogluconolactonase